MIYDQGSCRSAQTSFIHGATSLPHMKVQCPALYTFRNFFTSGFTVSHMQFTSVMSANRSDTPAKSLMGTRMLPRSNFGGQGCPQCALFSLVEPQSKDSKVPLSQDCFQCYMFITLVPEGSCPTKTSQRSQLSTDASPSMIWVMISAQIFPKAEQKTMPMSVSNHPNPGMNSWMPLRWYQGISSDLSSRVSTWDLAFLTQATGPNPKYLSINPSTTGFRLLSAMCIWMVPWECPMQCGFCLVTLLTQVKRAGRSKSAMCWKVNSQNYLFLSGLYLVWARECLFPLEFPSQMSQPLLARRKPGALFSSLISQVSEESKSPCWRMMGLRPSLICEPLRWMRKTVRMYPSSVITLWVWTGQLQYLQQSANYSLASGCAHPPRETSSAQSSRVIDGQIPRIPTIGDYLLQMPSSFPALEGSILGGQMGKDLEMMGRRGEISDVMVLVSEKGVRVWRRVGKQRWPSGLRRQIQALFRKGAGSNPVLYIFIITDILSHHKSPLTYHAHSAYSIPIPYISSFPFPFDRCDYDESAYGVMIRIRVSC